MERNELNELSSYLTEIATATKNGKITWEQVNPTTFSWITSPPNSARVTIQQVSTRTLGRNETGRTALINKHHYVFQAYGEGLVRLNYDGSSNSSLNQLLADIHEAARMSIARRGLDFLKRILPISE